MLTMMVMINLIVIMNCPSINALVSVAIDTSIAGPGVKLWLLPSHSAACPLQDEVQNTEATTRLHAD